MMNIKEGSIVTFKYRNYRDEISDRLVKIKAVNFGKAPEFYNDEQFFLTAFCLDRKAIRTFALNNIVQGTFKMVDM